MKFKIGDRVKNKIGEVGKVQEVLTHSYFVNYGDYAQQEFEIDLEIAKSVKLPTKKKVWQEAEKEKEAEIQAQQMVNSLCEYLSRI
ncbi:MAG: hypothetical protein J6T74_05855 [Clostridia bacterium]|nr:hypothetical protein [Clostridia bacterium]MBO7712069.1 hypothetical protein [Methanobrevibacter sp.]MBO7712142.1 hypothetical protein [Methanobrevibacter sp.]